MPLFPLTYKALHALSWLSYILDRICGRAGLKALSRDRKANDDDRPRILVGRLKARK
jgi:hypothetical protein